MPEPKFASPDGLAATVLVGMLIEELMDNGRMGSAGKARILDHTLAQLDAMRTEMAEDAANLVIDVFGLENRTRRG